MKFRVNDVVSFQDEETSQELWGGIEACSEESDGVYYTLHLITGVDKVDTRVRCREEQLTWIGANVQYFERER